MKESAIGIISSIALLLMLFRRFRIFNRIFKQSKATAKFYFVKHKLKHKNNKSEDEEVKYDISEEERKKMYE